MSVSKTIKTGSRAGRRLTLLSVALNIFLACCLWTFAIGYYLTPVPHGGSIPARRMEMLEARLSPDDASALHLEFIKKSEAIEHADAGFRRARDNVRVALSANPYDINATRAALSEAETAHQSVRRLFQDVIASAAARMTSEGRAKLADLLPAVPVNAGDAAPFPSRFFVGR